MLWTSFWTQLMDRWEKYTHKHLLNLHVMINLNILLLTSAWFRKLSYPTTHFLVRYQGCVTNSVSKTLTSNWNVTMFQAACASCGYEYWRFFEKKLSKWGGIFFSGNFKSNPSKKINTVIDSFVEIAKKKRKKYQDKQLVWFMGEAVYYDLFKFWLDIVLRQKKLWSAVFADIANARRTTDMTGIFSACSQWGPFF